MLEGKKITVVITGGIAAYKAPLFIRLLIKQGAQVRVAMTPHAQQFVTTETLTVLSQYPVLTEGVNYPEPVGHIALADWSDLMIVMPATANSISALATARADNEALSTLLASHSPVIVVPAMNHHMWEKQSLQRQIEQLRTDGYYILEPATGFLAEGYEGKGRMPEPEEVTQAVMAVCAFENREKLKALKGKRVVISAGGTQEAIDPVRYLSNHSSGKMGYALANVAAMLGAKVTLIRTNSTLNQVVLPEVETITVRSAVELADAMTVQEPQADIIIMAAAVSDYRVADVAENKIKKDKQAPEDERNLQLNLIENPDILAQLNKNGHYVVGFAAETQNVEQYAQAKRQQKGVDMIVANDVSDQTVGFGSEDNAVYIVREDNTLTLPKQNKVKIAAKIWEEVCLAIAE